MSVLALPAPVERLADLLGVPYVMDGVQDERGRWTTFAHPELLLPRPGLNCSGFVVAAARRLIGFQGSPAGAARDRRGDSGPGAPEGQDWDFGWDLVLNLSEGRPRRWLAPEGEQPVAADAAADSAGFRAQDAAAWARVRPRLRADRVYLAAFLRPRPGSARRQYHHVALLLKDSDGRVWLYQTLPRGRAHRLRIDTSQGYARFCTMFGPAERVRILEVEPPVLP
jgi:hypothetical protein